MLKKIWRVAFAILLISLMVLTCYFAFTSSKEYAQTDGHVNIVIKDMDGSIVSNKRVEYNKGDSCYKVLARNYKVKSTSSVEYGHFITAIDDIETSVSGDWFWFELAYLKKGASYTEELDPSMYDISDSTVGVDSIKLKDNMMIGITHRDATHTYSAFTDGLKVPSKESSNKAARIAIYTILAVLTLSFIIYAFVREKGQNGRLDVRKMCILSLMAVILFVQEEVLTILPNIQLTFLLISLYAAIFGIRYSGIIVLIHVLLDNIIMGSLNPIVMIPMLLGYLILVVVMNMLKDSNLLMKCIFASICSLIYCYLFLIVNAIFLDINVYAYWVSDIPFEILIVLSTILTITYLYRPLERIIRREWDKDKIEL